jgi:hypothetical protein
VLPDLTGCANLYPDGSAYLRYLGGRVTRSIRAASAATGPPSTRPGPSMVNDGLVAAGRMGDPRFRQQQLDGLRLPHIAPVNALVDELNDPGGRGWVPYLVPAYGGVAARILCVLRDPGPRTNAMHGGSGFLSPENDDPTARRFAALLDGAGIPVSEILAWNAYPWYLNGKPRAAELEAGVEPLRRLIGLLPGLRVVMLHGGSAQDGWHRLARRHPVLAGGLEAIPTFHTSSQAFIGTPEVRAARMTALARAFGRAARILQQPGPDDCR